MRKGDIACCADGKRPEGETACGGTSSRCLYLFRLAFCPITGGDECRGDRQGDRHARAAGDERSSCNPTQPNQSSQQEEAKGRIDSHSSCHLVFHAAPFG